MPDKYEIVLIKDLRRGDKFFWGNQTLEVEERFRIDEEYEGNKYTYGSAGYVRYLNGSRFYRSIDTYSDYPIIKFKD